MIKAPIIGASVGAKTENICNNAIILGLSESLKESLTIAVETETIPPAPRACPIRAKISIHTLTEKVHNNEKTK